MHTRKHRGEQSRHSIEFANLRKMWKPRLFLEAPDRKPVSQIEVARRIDAAIVAEDEAVRIIAIRRNRPIVAVVTDTADAPFAVVAITGRRIPDWAGRT